MRVRVCVCACACVVCVLVNVRVFARASVVYRPKLNVGWLVAVSILKRL